MLIINNAIRNLSAELDKEMNAQCTMLITGWAKRKNIEIADILAIIRGLLSYIAPIASNRFNEIQQGAIEQINKEGDMDVFANHQRAFTSLKKVLGGIERLNAEIGELEKRYDQSSNTLKELERRRDDLLYTYRNDKQTEKARYNVAQARFDDATTQYNDTLDSLRN